MSKNFLTTFNIFFPLIDFLYVLQLEEYDNARYIKTLGRFFFRRNIQKRDTLKFTSRIQTTALLTLGLIGIIIVVLYLFNYIAFAILIPIFFPLFVFAANFLLTPFYEFMKYRSQLKARDFVKTNKVMRCIAIAGSYGKTTTKNFLFDLLRYNYKVQMVPGNINTPTGIAVWVIKNLNKDTEILLVEMDTYFLGEIKRSCMVTPPDIAIITSIGDQHIERFGSKRKMAEAILEVFTYAKAQAKLFIFYSEAQKIERLKLALQKNVSEVKDSPLEYKTNIVSATARKNLLMAVTVLKEFSVPKAIVKDSLLRLTHPDRRQKQTVMHGYEAIDDSYNISFTTACAAVDELVKLGIQKHKKTVVITAGIPELGPENKQANSRYGEYLEKHVDEVILLQSIYAKEIMRKNFHLATDIPDSWKIIKNKYATKKYVLLIQPELTDLYY